MRHEDCKIERMVNTRRVLVGFWIGVILMTKGAIAAMPLEAGVYLLPINCSELLPDDSPFVQFFEAVGRGNATANRSFSKRIFRLVSMREKAMRSADRIRDQNPVDRLIRKTLC